VSRVRTLTPNFTVLTLKMWAYTAKIAEICNFWYKFAQKGYTPLSDFFKLSEREGISSPYPLAKFHQCHSENVGLQPTKSLKLIIFGINLLKKVYPLSDFYKIWLGEKRPRFAPSCQIVSLSVKKMWEYSPQNRRNWYFFV